MQLQQSLEFPMLVLPNEPSKVKCESPSEDTLEAFQQLNQPQGYTVDAESNVYDRNGSFVGIITPGRSDEASPTPELYRGKYLDFKTRWHLRLCLTCPLKEAECCKRT